MSLSAQLPYHLNSIGMLLPPPLAVSPTLLSSIPTLQDRDALEVHPGIREQLQDSSEYESDFVFIGSGPGGYYGALRAAQLGARVTVIEKASVGGTCLNVGCIPTKALLSCVGVLEQARRGAEFGVRVDGISIDAAAMMKHKDGVVTQLVRGVEGLFKKNKIRLIRGAGRIQDAHTVTVDTRSGSEEVRSRFIVIATGSEPAVLPMEGFEVGGSVWTSTEALSFDEPPPSLLIIGAGAIGLESAYTFAPLGTRVLVVEMMSQILPAADTETAKALQKSLEHKGIEFLLNSTVTRAEDTPTGKRVFIKSDGGEEPREFDKVLMAVGRRVLKDGIGLDEAGIEHDRRKIIVNDYLQTNVPNVYAIGDCIGEPMLAHVAWAEAVVAVEHALGVSSRRMNYDAVPACVYTNPECASVGMSEEQARERFGDIRIGKFGYSHNGKALGMREAEGYIKFISEPRFGQILGVHMIGPHVTDLIMQGVLAIANELTVDEVTRSIHPHPTLTEVVQEAAMDTQGRAIHK